MAAVATALVLAAVAACSPLPAEPVTAPGSFARDVDLAGQVYAVGSKEFDEQLLLCHMTIALLESAGADVVRLCDTEGSENVRADLIAGRIDMYWEYTGTAWRTYLRQEADLVDPDELFAAVRDADVANGVTWLTQAPFDNTYAIGLSATTAARLGVRTISDLAGLARSGSPDASLCIDREFSGREDGLVGLLVTYDLRFPDGALYTRPVDEIYAALAEGEPCRFGEVFATDGRLDELRLVTLVDDRAYFLPYRGALTVRTEVLARAPRLALVADRLAPMLSLSEMRRLNGRISVGGRSPEEVARGFLREQGLIG